MPDASGKPTLDVAATRKRIRALGRELSRENYSAAQQLYAPFHPSEPYPGVKLTRDLKYGPDERHRFDLTVPAVGATNLPVLIFLPGGGFVRAEKKMPNLPFYDNVMLFAARHGMAGINAIYRLAPQNKWPSGIEDTASIIRWILAHGAEHGIDAKRIFLMGQSAGGTNVAQYIAHPEFHPPGGHGLAAGLLISGMFEPNMKIYYGDDTSRWPGMSAFPGLFAAKLPLLVTLAENDPPEFERQAMTVVSTLYERDKRFPWFQRLWGHNHISAMLHMGLEPGDQLGDLILDFIATECP